MSNDKLKIVRYINNPVYVVYRKTAKGSWSRIANIKSGSTTGYTDTEASKGVTYTYTVRAYNGSTMSSFNSTKSAKR